MQVSRSVRCLFDQGRQLGRDEAGRSRERSPSAVTCPGHLQQPLICLEAQNSCPLGPVKGAYALFNGSTLTKSEAGIYHEREAARLRALLATAATPALKAWL